VQHVLVGGDMEAELWTEYLKEDTLWKVSGWVGGEYSNESQRNRLAGCVLDLYGSWQK
jgi:hypothetical protein